MMYESLMEYESRGFIHSINLCHLRIYDEGSSLPVVIVGELSDTEKHRSLTNDIEIVADAVSRKFFSGGTEFRLVEHHPSRMSNVADPIFEEVAFPELQSTRNLPDDRRYRSPTWHPVDIVKLLEGASINVWRPKYYTAYAVAGDEGERIRKAVAARNRMARDRTGRPTRA
jgi:hypothetical protein